MVEKDIIETKISEGKEKAEEKIDEHKEKAEEKINYRKEKLNEKREHLTNMILIYYFNANLIYIC